MRAVMGPLSQAWAPCHRHGPPVTGMRTNGRTLIQKPSAAPRFLAANACTCPPLLCVHRTYAGGGYSQGAQQARQQQSCVWGVSVLRQLPQLPGEAAAASGEGSKMCMLRACRSGTHCSQQQLVGSS